MVHEDVSQDENTERDVNVSLSDPALAIPHPQETWSGMVWQWPSLILVQRTPSADDPHSQDAPVLLAPNRRGFAFAESLGILDDVQSIWIVRWTQEGQLIAESVRQVRTWGFRLQGDREESLTVLFCVSGAVFVADEDGIFEVDEGLKQWFGGGNHKPYRKFLETFTVEGVVVALLPESQVAKVHTADGREYLISRHTDGDCFEALNEGVRVKCEVTRRPSMVLSASILGHATFRAVESPPPASKTE